MNIVKKDGFFHDVSKLHFFSGLLTDLFFFKDPVLSPPLRSDYTAHLF